MEISRSLRLAAPYALRRGAASLLAAALMSAALLGAAGPAFASETAPLDAEAAAEPAPGRVSAAAIEALIPLAAEIGDVGKLEVYYEPAPAPNIVFSDVDGDPVALSDFRGRIVLVNFWATFCPPCIEEMPALDALQTALGGEAFEVVAINVDLISAARARAWLATNGIDALAFYRDQSRQSALAFGERALPLTLLIDRSGAEVGRLIGAAKWDSETAKEAISLLIDDIDDMAAAKPDA
ncbi:MAG: TlpA disulfide reductase family protein [Pseudomonadota bacterium]